jgi:hypothetical protein
MSTTEKWDAFVARLSTPPYREAVICLSLANLCFFRVWKETLTFSENDAYFMKVRPSAADYWATILDVLLLGTVLFGITIWSRKHLSGRMFRFVQLGGAALALIPLNGIRAILVRDFGFRFLEFTAIASMRWYQWTLLGVVGLAALWFAFKWQETLITIAAAALHTMIIFCVMTFSQAAWKGFRSAPYAPVQLASLLPNAQAAPRVIWAIFDEWDYRLTFQDRPTGLALPALDRLRAESVFASSARAPGNRTAVSLPALLTGRQPRAAAGEANDKPLEFDGKAWNQIPTLITEARRAGFNTAIAGWNFPYCRLFNDTVSKCDWWPRAMPSNSTGDTLLKKMAGQFESLVETESYSLFGQSLKMRHATKIYKEYLTFAKSAVADPTLGVVFMHAPVPHPPHPYNRLTGQFDGVNRPRPGYANSLALLDRTVQALRQEMEEAGTWGTTAVLLSSDHPYREARRVDGKADPRVPFILRMPGAEAGTVYTANFNTIVSGELLMSVLRGTVRTNADVTAWLDEHRHHTQEPLGTTDSSRSSMPAMNPALPATTHSR